MSISAESTPNILLTTPGPRVSIPPWMRHYAPKTISGDRVGTLRELPDITVVEAAEPNTLLKREGFLSTLAARHAGTPGPSKVLFVFRSKKSPSDVENLEQLLVFFSRFRDVEFVRGVDQADFALQGSWAKLLRSRSGSEPPSDDPLGKIASVIAATADLRADSGRLSAQKVAACFGVPVAELARLLGRSRQAVSKTDDSESAQAGLAALERIARLRAVLPGEAFRAWLNLDNDLLDGRSPLAVIRDGAALEVAQLAEDMLSGNPG